VSGVSLDLQHLCNSEFVITLFYVYGLFSHKHLSKLVPRGRECSGGVALSLTSLVKGLAVHDLEHNLLAALVYNWMIIVSIFRGAPPVIVRHFCIRDLASVCFSTLDLFRCVVLLHFVWLVNVLAPCMDLCFWRRLA
jgi:hypothetical protein